MKILYDHQIFSYQVVGGASRYFCELLKNIPADMWDVSALLSNNYYLESSPFDKKRYFNFFKNVNFPKKERLMLELGKPYSLYKVINNNYDILHLTHYESYCLNATKKPIVLSYLDKLFSSFAYNNRTIQEQKKCLKKVEAVITISENTKKDLIDIFSYPENKIFVIYLGCNKLNYSIKTLPSIIDSRYILFVGGREGYKNFKSLLYSFAIIHKKDDELKLICTGKAFSREELAQIKDLNLEKHVLTRFVTDSELHSLYKYAELFVFPSKYEGFGMPLLEAMGNECPVICSNASCFPEIAQDAALYFDPDSVDSLTFMLEKVLYNNQTRKDLIEKGLLRSQFFSWKKCVNEHIKLYQSLL